MSDDLLVVLRSAAQGNKDAQDHLESLRNAPNFSVALVMVIRNEQIEYSLRLLAATQLKYACAWLFRKRLTPVSPNSSQPALSSAASTAASGADSDALRAQLKQLLLESFALPDHRLASQLHISAATVAKHHFTEWPELIQLYTVRVSAILQELQSGQSQFLNPASSSHLPSLRAVQLFSHVIAELLSRRLVIRPLFAEVRHPSHFPLLFVSLSLYHFSSSQNDSSPLCTSCSLDFFSVLRRRDQ